MSRHQTAPVTAPAPSPALETLAALDSLIQQAGNPKDAVASANAKMAAPMATPMAINEKISLPKTQQIAAPKDDKYSGPSGPDGATVADVQDPVMYSPAPPAKEVAGPSVPFAPQAVAPTNPQVPAAAPAQFLPVIGNPSRLFFTGRSGAGKRWLASQIGATIFDPRGPVLDYVARLVPSGTSPKVTAELVQTIVAWGNGEVSAAFPFTPARCLFISAVRKEIAGWENFGAPAFWMNLLIGALQSAGGTTVITRVADASEYAALKAAGYTHFHIMASPQTFSLRGSQLNATDRLATALDQDAVKKVSAQRTGEKLPVIWNDSTVAAPSPRLWTVPEVLDALRGGPVGPVGETVVEGPAASISL
jgi:hypothetical protein